MKKSTKLALAALGVAGLALAGQPAQAQTITLNGTGSSAGRAFAGLTPSYVCDPGTQALFFFNNNTGDPSAPSTRSEWQCKVGGVDHIFRYFANASRDGFTFVTGAVQTRASFLDTAHAGCANIGAPNPRTIGGHTNVLVKNCVGNPGNVSFPIHYGASDVKASSFNQAGFGGSVTPPPDSTVTFNPIVTVPFAIVVGPDVRGGDGNPLTSLRKLELQQILAGVVTDWTVLGHNTTTTDKRIVTCQRTPGSGTLSTLDVTIMKGPGLASINGVTSATNIGNVSSGNVVDCMNNNAFNPLFENTVGYIDSDSVQLLTNGAYKVRIDGAEVFDATLPADANRLKDLRCGKYPYWADWGIVTRNSGLDGLALPGGGTIPVGTDNALALYIDRALNNNPLPGFWAKQSEMFVFKNEDRGPHNWIAGGESFCSS
jgi:ABC-type phosphate transport system substrate-binding protein